MNNYTLWGEGVVFVGGTEAFESQNVGLTLGLETIEGLKGDGGGKIVIPVGSLYTGRIEFLGMNAEILEKLTGATNTSGRNRRVRGEAQTKATNTVTLSNTPITDAIRIIPTGTNKQPLKQVASAPAVGEYSISGAAITLNASQTETDFLIDYMYNDSGSGSTSQFGPTSLPSAFSLYASLRAKELFTDAKDDVVIKALKCERTSELNFGAGNRDLAAPGFDYSIRVDAVGDFDISWPSA